MKPKIFISHSCKDDEEPAEPVDPGRVQRLEFARALRTELDEALRKSGQYDVWLDRRNLESGKEWRLGIHRALRDCHGAVLLLSPEALASGWVLKETTILVWRALLGEPVLVIPIQVGVSADGLEACGFEPSGVDAVQAEIVHAPTAEERHRVVAAVVERFDTATHDMRSVSSMWSKTVGRWVKNVAGMLRMNDPSYAEEMLDVLGLVPDESRFDDLYLTVAGELLDCETDDVLDVFNVVYGARTGPQRQQFIDAVEWLWVSSQAAQRLPLIAAGQGVRLAAIDAEAPTTGEAYVHQAYCRGLRADRVTAPDGRTDGTDEQAIARVRTALMILPPTHEGLRRDIERNGPFFLVLGGSLCCPAVLRFVMENYRYVTVVALTGNDEAGRLGEEFVEFAQRLRPPLGTGEDDGRRYQQRLGCYR